MCDQDQHNSSGVDCRFNVGTVCICCAVCKDLAPNNFEPSPNTESFRICKQPRTEKELDQVLDAVDACPVGAIKDHGEAAASNSNPANGAQ